MNCSILFLNVSLEMLFQIWLNICLTVLKSTLLMKSLAVIYKYIFSKTRSHVIALEMYLVYSTITRISNMVRDTSYMMQRTRLITCLLPTLRRVAACLLQVVIYNLYNSCLGRWELPYRAIKLGPKSKDCECGHYLLSTNNLLK